MGLPRSFYTYSLQQFTSKMYQVKNLLFLFIRKSIVNVKSLFDTIDVHFATVFFRRINLFFILIVYRAFPTFNQTVRISMHGVDIYVYIIQHKAKTYEMLGKMSKRCLMVAIENDQHLQHYIRVVF